MITEPKMRDKTRSWRVILTVKQGLIAVFLLLAVPANLVAQSSEKKSVAGVWEVKITAGGVQSPLLSIASLARTAVLPPPVTLGSRWRPRMRALEMSAVPGTDIGLKRATESSS
jgi:hypothetical protein